MESENGKNVNQNLVVQNEKEIIANIVLNGDIGKLSPIDKVNYYNMFCESLGLNPVTQPFDIIKFQGKERLYAKKDATEQLRKINGVSIVDMTSKSENGLYIVQARAQDKTGKIDISTGAVSIKGLAGDALANAIMKAETKAKRRVTLSICGLGILDETELETIPEMKKLTAPKNITPEPPEPDKPFFPDKKDIPEDITKFFEDRKFKKADVRAFCEPLGWDWEKVRGEIEKFIECMETKEAETGEAKNESNS